MIFNPRQKPFFVVELNQDRRKVLGVRYEQENTNKCSGGGYHF